LLLAARAARTTCCRRRPHQPIDRSLPVPAPGIMRLSQPPIPRARSVCVHAVPVHRCVPGLITCQMIARSARVAIHPSAAMITYFHLPTPRASLIRCLRRRRELWHEHTIAAGRPAIVPRVGGRRYDLSPACGPIRGSVCGHLHCQTDSIVHLLTAGILWLACCHHCCDWDRSHGNNRWW
jgi:hypothetical protein